MQNTLTLKLQKLQIVCDTHNDKYCSMYCQFVMVESIRLLQSYINLVLAELNGTLILIHHFCTIGKETNDSLRRP